MHFPFYQIRVAASRGLQSPCVYGEKLGNFPALFFPFFIFFFLKKKATYLLPIKEYMNTAQSASLFMANIFPRCIEFVFVSNICRYRQAKKQWKSIKVTSLRRGRLLRLYCFAATDQERNGPHCQGKKKGHRTETCQDIRLLLLYPSFYVIRILEYQCAVDECTCQSRTSEEKGEEVKSKASKMIP